jgi:hypothetical protein
VAGGDLGGVLAAGSSAWARSMVRRSPSATAGQGVSPVRSRAAAVAPMSVVFASLEEALREYSPSDRDQAGVPIEELVAAMLEKHDIVCANGLLRPSP